MTGRTLSDRATKMAEAVHEACLQAAMEAYEDASIRGLCAEGAWECAVGAMRSLDLDVILERQTSETDVEVDHGGKRETD